MSETCLKARVDAHHHFWRLARGDYHWLTAALPALLPLYRDYLVDDLLPYLYECGINRTVLVQAAATESETEFLLDIAASTPVVGAVIGWIDLAAPDAPDRLRRLARRDGSKLRGVRPMLQDLADVDWLLKPELEPALKALVDLDLVLDALVNSAHLPVLLRFFERHAEVKIVVDHAAKPPIRSGWSARWAEGMQTLAKQTTAFCKLSGLVTEANDDWTAANICPYVDQLLEWFGTGRLMWGSDWPVVNLAGGYVRWHAVSTACLEHLHEIERDRILGLNAVKFYRIAHVD